MESEKNSSFASLEEKSEWFFSNLIFLNQNRYHNIALPLILEKAPKEEIDKKVKEVLRFVELEDKKDVYVSQLSGGQKQRVGNCKGIDNNTGHSAL